jgi:predicted nucleic-acid-binding protein
MIGLDTNVIVRYVMQDDPAQFRSASKLIESLSAENRAFLGLVVIVELVWVLRTSYQTPRQGIAKVLDGLLQTREFTIERADLVGQALRLYTDGGADFADCLIERCASASDCDLIFTFDRIASAATGMRLLS